jgi:hypothetical protein
MALGALPELQVRPTRRAPRVSPQGARIATLPELQVLAPQRSRRARERALIPKRSRTYFGVDRAGVVPRIPPATRALDPSERDRETLIARTRYFAAGQAPHPETVGR